MDRTADEKVHADPPDRLEVVEGIIGPARHFGLAVVDAERVLGRPVCELGVSELEI